MIFRVYDDIPQYYHSIYVMDVFLIRINSTIYYTLYDLWIIFPRLLHSFSTYILIYQRVNPVVFLLTHTNITQLPAEAQPDDLMLLQGHIFRCGVSGFTYKISKSGRCLKISYPQAPVVLSSPSPFRFLDVFRVYSNHFSDTPRAELRCIATDPPKRCKEADARGELWRTHHG